jgi:hypothetical protein
MKRLLLLLTFATLLVAQSVNNYLGPNEKTSGPELVRVQILVNDDPNPQGVQIVSAQFDGQAIPLKPRDIYGFRGQASFQLRPAKYTLKWKVRRDRRIWPRTTTHEEEVLIDPRDLWLQITITGDQASIT